MQNTTQNKQIKLDTTKDITAELMLSLYAEAEIKHRLNETGNCYLVAFDMVHEHLPAIDNQGGDTPASSERGQLLKNLEAEIKLIQDKDCSSYSLPQAPALDTANNLFQWLGSVVDSAPMHCKLFVNKGQGNTPSWMAYLDKQHPAIPYILKAFSGTGSGGYRKLTPISKTLYKNFVGHGFEAMYALNTDDDKEERTLSNIKDALSGKHLAPYMKSPFMKDTFRTKIVESLLPIFGKVALTDKTVKEIAPLMNDELLKQLVISQVHNNTEHLKYGLITYNIQVIKAEIARVANAELKAQELIDEEKARVAMEEAEIAQAELTFKEELAKEQRLIVLSKLVQKGSITAQELLEYKQLRRGVTNARLN